MDRLTRFDWRAMDAAAGLKATAGLLLMILLGTLTGQSWIVGGLAVLFAWLVAVPGPTRLRLRAIAGFAAGALALTLLTGWIGLALTPNLLSITATGFVGTVVLLWGHRVYMVGYGLICWMIYAPFLVANTSVTSCVLSILAGCAIMALLAAVPAKNTPAPPPEPVPTRRDRGFVLVFALTVALALLLGTFLGWTRLSADATLIAGAALFVIGFDGEPSWEDGLARMIGIAAGTWIGFALASMAGDVLLLKAVTLACFFMAFAAAPVHPGAFFFFFLIYVTVGWTRLEPEAEAVTLGQKLLWEGAGIGIGLAAIALLHSVRRARPSGLRGS